MIVFICSDTLQILVCWKIISFWTIISYKCKKEIHSKLTKLFAPLISVKYNNIIIYDIKLKNW
jgi:hypothetical protein